MTKISSNNLNPLGLLVSFVLISCSGIENISQKSGIGIDAKPFIGFAVVDNQNRIFKSENADHLFTPASLLKLYHYPLFQTVEKDSSYLTTTFSVYSSGDSTSLAIFSNGDPLLTMREIDSAAEIINNKFPNLTKVQISVLNYDSAEFWGRGWMYDDEPDDYQSYLNSFPINENTLTIEYQRLNGIDSITYHDFFLQKIIYNSKFSITRDNDNKIVIHRPDSVLNISKTQKIFSFRKPNEIISDYIKKKFGVNEVQWSLTSENDKKIPVETITIKHSFDQLMSNIYTRSSNFSAEQTLRYIGLKSNHIGSIRNGLLFEKTIRPNNSFRIADGSGLSRYNLISISSLLPIMNDAAINNKLKTWFAEYAKTGTLDDRMALPNNTQIYGKSGSMTGIQNIAGFIFKDGKYLGYFIIMKNNTTESKNARYSHESEMIQKFVKWLD